MFYKIWLSFTNLISQTRNGKFKTKKEHLWRKKYFPAKKGFGKYILKGVGFTYKSQILRFKMQQKVFNQKDAECYV